MNDTLESSPAGGIEKLLALAAVSAEWRQKVLADPLAAAREAGLKLTGGERAVISSVTRESLEQMIRSCSGGRPLGASRLGRTATRTAAAALLATSLTGCEGCGPRSPATEGVRPEIPIRRRQPAEKFAEREPREPDQQEEPVAEPEPAKRGGPDSNEGLRTDPEKTPVDTTEPNLTGIRPDVPPERETAPGRGEESTR